VRPRRLFFILCGTPPAVGLWRTDAGYMRGASPAFKMPVARYTLWGEQRRFVRLMGLQPHKRIPIISEKREGVMTNRSTLFLIAATILALGAGSVFAQEREFVGVTTAATLPNVGILTLHEMCNADFPGSRMCSSADILANGGVGVSHDFGPLVWLQPTLVAGESGGWKLDASGVATHVVSGLQQSLSCFNWSVDFASVGGLVLSPGRISASSCDNSYPVACCSAKKVKE
jgi:hypothetical protein